MRIGVMVGPERGRYAHQGRPPARRRPVGRGRRALLGLGPADPRRVRRPHRRRRSSASRPTRIEIGTAVVPVQPRHPIALAQQALSVQAVCEGRLTLGLGVSHHWIIDEMLGLPYEQPGGHDARPTSTCSSRPSPVPGPVDVENDLFRVHNPLDITDVGPDARAHRRPRPADAAAGRRAHRRHDPVDGRRAGHRRPRRARRSPRPPTPPVGPRRGSWPASRCACAATTRSTSPSPAPTASCPRPRCRPNYQQLLDHGDAR